MKAKGIICWCVLFWCSSFAWGDEWAHFQMAKMASMPTSPTAEDLVHLSIISAVEVNDDEECRNVVALAKQKILSTPDFPEKLQRYLSDERAKWKATGSGDEYDFKRYRLLEGIGQVSDPRVVKMLGELLPDMERTVDVHEHVASGADWTVTPPNAILAAQALAKLLKDSPAEKNPRILDGDILVWRAWYDEVKAGTRTFAFRGRPENYRFKSDGSWEAIPILGSPKAQ